MFAYTCLHVCARVCVLACGFAYLLCRFGTTFLLRSPTCKIQIERAGARSRKWRWQRPVFCRVLGFTTHPNTFHPPPGKTSAKPQRDLGANGLLQRFLDEGPQLRGLGHTPRYSWFWKERRCVSGPGVHGVQKRGGESTAGTRSPYDTRLPPLSTLHPALSVPTV